MKCWELSDNITVIRKGKDVGGLTRAEATKEKIANMMVGRVVLFEVKRPDVKNWGNSCKS